MVMMAVNIPAYFVEFKIILHSVDAADGSTRADSYKYAWT